ncbi:tRNA (uridine(34)/cytosine(34)/5-carboxymethylaminomethyluridine(34)-2'-O)-methyltransferase TrmL [Oceanirhabdus seepicola]|uniref:Putative tRNA (cytidine(34)-2'-O)-methyltransferase n=1 Tax=Oceanirhabdus seepicola TaxID=2828781 RepID=A0A9J6P3K9_9CLOT|nr:tRNA (uridine(34)/cytosine(34)/5-carboxymethylaminomethyluridine(34)-2'-O)-methyltransferase TrmL [Oceanirhabdus seepicola]MCM1990405.1 tRNA (uridine(34)/cytosine(34)/5-carboxymethylaminomethyluridine(34)-2'-O)-methyltransferase TrmL [Oceanirhabdus seepicola]
MNINIVLFQPEIPHNTGAIGRTCVLTNCTLHLIKPLGFEINEKAVRRAGLDYWKHVKIEEHDSYEDLRAKYPESNFYFCTTKGKKDYTQVQYEKGDFLVFGRESSGLPDYIRENNKDNCIRVPMVETTTRSLNLSNTANIIVYEALRQLGFPGMK